jgi:hypothetical protein
MTAAVAVGGFGLPSGPTTILGTSVRRVLLLAFAVFFALSASWALTDPLGAPIDEETHMAWAAAVTDGQFSPVSYDQEVRWGLQIDIVTYKVRVPEELMLLDEGVSCYVQHPDIYAQCTLKPDAPGKIVLYHTSMGSYNPLYYLLVGWPIHVLPGLDGLYGMRLMSALICSILLACAAALALRVGRMAFCGVLVAATPMALFLAGSVNPNGPEAAGGLLAFTALSALALDPRPALVRVRAGLFALGAGVVAIVRPAGLEWFAILAGMAVLMLSARGLLALVRDRRSWPALGGLLAALLFATAWNLTRGGLNSIPAGKGDGYTVGMSLRDTFRHLPGTLTSMIGGVGWNDTSAPFGTEAGWLVLLGFLVLGAVTLAGRRQLLVLGVMAGGIVLIPFVANAWTAPGLINLWEGRYGLWFAAGLPVYAAMVLCTGRDRLPRATLRRVPPLVYATVALGQLGMYWVVVRRYGVGIDGPLIPHVFKWSPPMGWDPGCQLLFLGLGLCGLLIWRFGGARADTTAAAPHDASAAEPQSLLTSSTDIATAM